MNTTSPHPRIAQARAGTPPGGSPERAGFTVTWAVDARAGRAALYEGGVDLAVLDLGLPDGSGLELLRAAGFDAHPPKPLPLADLLDLLERLERLDGA